jgi:hypothetical protein
MFASDTIKWAQEWELWLEGLRNRTSGKLDHVHKNDIKHLSNMF